MGAFEHLQGAGGGGKGGGGGGSQRTPQEAPNTLRATSKARLVDLLGEGPIVGLANGMQSVFFDETPLQAANGEWNFQGVTVHTRNGEPDQAHIPGFPAVESTTEVSAQVKHGAPITRTIGTLDADAVRVTVQLPALSHQNVENGDLVGAAVEIAIDVRRGGGGWQERRRDTIQGKTTSPYQRSYRVELEGAGPWDVRVRRLSADDDTATTQNDTYWAYTTTIIDAKLNYPDSALMGIEVDAAQFGNAIPARAYDVKGLIVQVPDNYDPETRTYSGFWSGNFKLAWTDNPAWCYHDLARKMRYGAGLRNIDKWELYRIAQYCDELVPDGFGGEEPRFTFNTVMADEVDALRALHTVASAFRGMTYWGTNTVMPVADMPRDPVKLVTPANVIDGEFVYEGTALKARHSVAHVSYNDPNDGYRKSVEVVENAAALEKFGYRKIDIEAIACTSRAQARRLGEWILASEEAETETVSYRCSVDHADLRPGDIVKVSDPATAGARLGGRVTVSGTQALTLDQVPDAVHGQRWFLDVMLPNGRPERRAVAAFDGDQVRLDQPLSATPVTGAMWILSSQSIEPRQFRVLAVSESTGEGGGLEYHVTALEHDPTKYARIELGIELEPPNYTLLPSGPVSPPYAITAQAFTYLAGGTEHQGMTISWTPSDDPRVQRYILEVQGPADMQWRTVYTETGTSVDLRDVDPGQWMIRVRGVTALGTGSPWVTLITNVAGLLLPVPPDSVDIEVGTFSVTLRPRGLYPGAMWEFWRSGVALEAHLIESNAVNLGVATVLTDTDRRSATTYFYYVRGINAYGVSTWYPVQATTLEQFDDIIEAIDKNIYREGGVVEQWNERLDHTREALEQADAAMQEAIDNADAKIAGATESVEQAREELQTRLDAADGRLSSASEQLEQAREQIEDVDERVSGFDQRIGDNAASIERVERAGADGRQALAEDVGRVAAETNAALADNRERVSALATDQVALTERVSDSEASLDGFRSSTNISLQALAEAGAAMTQQIDAAQSAIDDNQADIEEVSKTLASNDAADVFRRLAMQAQALGNAAQQDIDRTVSVDERRALSERLEALSAEFGGNLATVRDRITALTDADSALAQSFLELDAAFEASRSALSTELTALSTAQRALTRRVETAESTLGDNTGSIETIEQTLAGEEAVNVFRRLALQAQALGNAAQHDVTVVVEATERQALAAEQNRLSAKVGENEALNESRYSALSTENSATSARVEQVRAEANGKFANVEQELMAIVDPKGGVVARYLVTTEVNGKKAMIGMQADGTTAEIMLIADQTAIINPVNGQLVTAFVVSDGRVVIRDALIASLGVEKLRALDGSLAFENGRLRADLIDAQRLRLRFGQIDDVWIQNAQIANGAIDSAKIRNLSVGTLQIGEDAVSVSSSFESTAQWDAPQAAWQDAGSLWHDAQGGATVVWLTVDASVASSLPSGAPVTAGFAVRVLLNGTTVRNFGFVRSIRGNGLIELTESWSSAATLPSYSGWREIVVQVQFNGNIQRRVRGCSAITISRKR
ncbi:TipJ family phage tail tip protein [Vreelandella malpeensis]|uniref:DUF1983 domain-containing protein n=1 Tax=Vreelandella malpeensis TaxID=1172368 RepID=A0ABS8DV29_9GAMM|nr:phage tail protein [Halomonas malpeensis]MCB8889920.1 DUF1983 domain-containing protein [Halomonas malpeensis]